MNLEKNENGYALLTVLMLVLLFTILGMGLLAMNINASKQFNNKEEQVYARHLAEMGLLHYHAALTTEVESYSFGKKSGESNKDALKRSRKELCDRINSVSTGITPGSNYVITTLNVSGCNTLSEEEKILVKVESEGIASENMKKSVEGTITLSPPSIQSASPSLPAPPLETIPGMPVQPPNYKPKDFQPNIVNHGYVEMNVPFTPNSKKSSYHFMDHFVIRGFQGDAFVVKPPNKGNVTVEKNLYMDGNLFIQNQFCLYVKGDMVVNGNLKIQSSGHANIYVFGNVSLSTIPELKENQLYVKGNVYIGGKKASSTKYKDFSTNNKHCNVPPSWVNPDETIPDNETIPGSTKYEWDIGENLNPKYL
ncbi:hypothetical protein M4S82_09180 [Planococcus sp. MERTA32b]|nr:hypothetical protein [Planococcus sp. MER TA 32b]